MQKLIPVIQLWKKDAGFPNLEKNTKEFDIKNMPRISYCTQLIACVPLSSVLITDQNKEKQSQAWLYIYISPSNDFPNCFLPEKPCMWHVTVNAMFCSLLNFLGGLMTKHGSKFKSSKFKSSKLRNKSQVQTMFKCDRHSCFNFLHHSGPWRVTAGRCATWQIRC